MNNTVQNFGSNVKAEELQV